MEITDKEIRDFVNGVYSGNLSPENIPTNIYIKTGSILMAEIYSGFGRSFFDPDIIVGDLETLKKFHSNVFLFSGAKTVNQAIDLQTLMFDSSGYLRPFNDYYNDAIKLVGAYNKNWLYAERNAALNLSQAARRWQDIIETKGTFTSLQYVTKEDGHVRQSHRILHGIVRPVDHAFWKTHYPPIDWGCRCDVDQLLKEEAGRKFKGRIDKEVMNTPNDLFKFNPGIDMKIFHQDHPYFKALNKYPYLKELIPDLPVK